MNNKKLISIAIVAIMVLTAFAVFGSLPQQQTAAGTQNAKASGIATSLGGNAALAGSSLGVRIPHAINPNYTHTPPLSIGAISYAPNYTAVNEPIIFTVGSASGGLPPYTYTWSFNGVPSSQQGQSVMQVFSKPGDYKVVATASDGIGQHASTSITVDVLSTLMISVTPNATHVKTGQPVSFSYVISGGHAPYRLTWNFGNNNLGTMKDVNTTGVLNTTFIVPGSYTAVFVVYDIYGHSASSVFNINVTNSKTVITHIPPISISTYILSPQYEGTMNDLFVNVTGGTGYNNVTVVWGDHTANNYSKPTSGLGIFNESLSFAFPHIYAQAALYTITVTVLDSQGVVATAYVPVDVLYLPPTAFIGYSYVSAGVVHYAFPSNHTVTMNVTTANTTGIELAGNITNGAEPYTWYANNTTKELAHGIQATPDTPFNLTRYKTDVPGTHFVTLTVRDHYGNKAYANLTIIVTTKSLYVTLLHSFYDRAPFMPGPFNATLDQTVYFQAQIHNIMLNSTGAVDVNVSYSNGTSHLVHYKTLNFTGTAGAIEPIQYVDFTGTYKSLGTYTAFATANYGKTFSNASSAHYSKSVEVVTVKSIPSVSFKVYVVPVSRFISAGQDAEVFVNVSGGDGNYALNDLFANNTSGVIFLTSANANELIDNGNATPYANITLNSTGKAMATTDLYYNFSFFVRYDTDNKVDVSMTFSGLINDTTAGFSAPFEITFIVQPAIPLDVTVQASTQMSYASDSYSAYTPGSTNFTLWVNVTGEHAPYTIYLNYSYPVVFHNEAGVDELHVSTNTSVSATYTNITDVDGHYIGAKLTYSGPAPVSIKITGLEFVSSTRANPNAPYQFSVHMINATVHSGTYFVSGAYDEIAIPYLEINDFTQSATSIVAPGVVSFDVAAIFGEFPNMHNYTYHWYLNGLSLVNTTTSAISIPFSVNGTYCVNATVVSPTGEIAYTHYLRVTVAPAFEVVQVISARVLATMTNETGYTFIMNAGPVDWAENGTLYASLTVPQTTTGNYTLNVTYSYTLMVTEFQPNPYLASIINEFEHLDESSVHGINQTTVVTAVSYLLGSWETYAANVYNTTPVMQKIAVISQPSANAQFDEILGQLAVLQTSIGRLTVNVADLNASVAQVSGNTVLINTKLGMMNTTLTAIGASVSEVLQNSLVLTTELGSVQATLSQVDAQLVSFNSSLAVVNTTVGQLKLDVANLNASIAAVNGNLVSVKTSLGTMSASLTSINGTVTSNAAGISTLVGSTAKISTSIGTLSGTVTSISNGVATVQTGVGNLNVSVSAIKTKVNSLASSLSDDLLLILVTIVLVVITLALVTVLYGRVNKLSKASEQLNKQQQLDQLNKQQPPKQ